MYAKPKLPMKKRTILILTILAAGVADVEMAGLRVQS